MAAILFINHGVNPTLKNKKETKQKLLSIFKEENKDVTAVSYIFCDDAFLLELNQKFLDHDTYTDILTFPLSNPEEPIEAEIYISTERTAENAVLHGTTPQEELQRVMIHGILHLCGYKDHSNDEKQLMRQKEDFYLNRLFHVEQREK